MTYIPVTTGSHQPTQAFSRGDASASLGLAVGSIPNEAPLVRGSVEAKQHLKCLKVLSDAFSPDGTTLSDPYRDHLIRTFYYAGDKAGEQQARAYEISDRGITDFKTEAFALRNLKSEHIAKLRTFIDILKTNDESLKNVQTTLKRIMRIDCDEERHLDGWDKYFRSCDKRGMQRSDAIALIDDVLEYGNGEEVYRSSLRVIDQKWPFLPAGTLEAPTRPEACRLVKPILIEEIRLKAKTLKQRMAPQGQDGASEVKLPSKTSAFDRFGASGTPIGDELVDRPIAPFRRLLKSGFYIAGNSGDNEPLSGHGLRRALMDVSFATLRAETHYEEFGKPLARKRTVAEIMRDTNKRAKTLSSRATFASGGNPVITTPGTSGGIGPATQAIEQPHPLLQSRAGLASGAGFINAPPATLGRSGPTNQAIDRSDLVTSALPVSRNSAFRTYGASGNEQ